MCQSYVYSYICYAFLYSTPYALVCLSHIESLDRWTLSLTSSDESTYHHYALISYHSHYVFSRVLYYCSVHCYAYYMWRHSCLYLSVATQTLRVGRVLVGMDCYSTPWLSILRRILQFGVIRVNVDEVWGIGLCEALMQRNKGAANVSDKLKRRRKSRWWKRDSQQMLSQHVNLDNC